MGDNISLLFVDVNKLAVLTSYDIKNKNVYMRYGERLKRARGEMTQARLSELSGVSQSLISQLENSETATGSEYTNRLARALEISPDWLADEIGEMRMPGMFVTDPKLIAGLKVMQDLPGYGKDAAIKAIVETAELIERARSNGDGTNG